MPCYRIPGLGIVISSGKYPKVLVTSGRQKIEQLANLGFDFAAYAAQIVSKFSQFDVSVPQMRDRDLGILGSHRTVFRTAFSDQSVVHRKRQQHGIRSRVSNKDLVTQIIVANSSKATHIRIEHRKGSLTEQDCLGERSAGLGCGEAVANRFHIAFPQDFHFVPDAQQHRMEFLLLPFVQALLCISALLSGYPYRHPDCDQREETLEPARKTRVRFDPLQSARQHLVFPVKAYSAAAYQVHPRGAS